MAIDKTAAPWNIRKQILELKGELKELDDIEEKQIEYEQKIIKKELSSTTTPLRKRVAMIPTDTYFP